MGELPVIQKTYDFVKWFVPILNKLPRDHKFMLGDRMITELYELLEGLVKARYAKDKLTQLSDLNTKLDILRYQTRLLSDFELISVERYQYISQQLQEIGIELGGWIKQQKQSSYKPRNNNETYYQNSEILN
ncbi:diversity-generating retroelement protein Avd [Crocosphaera sp. XPORK-15E]|uniref:diversity-generating retroelement protein Avd n=1 Tax=Crocosphaera sp. XPORK-15E TaxID=3110247 RepID=UPI002B1FC44A|nr:diversity-generating retroelement protein Avd [Crocosphaera sp. XPORK-15E]MEA5537034.1 diversity-generating retroelement protein Avd [Crocosphaera sp. XPORK-15E]